MRIGTVLYGSRLFLQAALLVLALWALWAGVSKAQDLYLVDTIACNSVEEAKEVYVFYMKTPEVLTLDDAVAGYKGGASTCFHLIMVGEREIDFNFTHVEDFIDYEGYPTEILSFDSGNGILYFLTEGEQPLPEARA